MKRLADFLLGVVLGLFVGSIIWVAHYENTKLKRPALTPVIYTLGQCTYAEFPSGAVVNLTLDSMAKESRVVLQYQQILKPCE